MRRIGKNFYVRDSPTSISLAHSGQLILSSPPHPVFHLGMAGSTQIRGLAATTYRLPRSRNDPSVWPPKYCKLVLTFSTLDGSPMAEWAFCDSRRLARIKLVDQEVPEEHPPLSLLGRDPFLDMPPLEVLSPALLKRNSPIKAVLLNQNGPLSGIGNWIVDEVLFQARLHPTHPASLLSAPDLSILHEKIKYIIDFAVEVNADHRQFPPDWLFMKRWGKGKKKVPQYEMNGTSHPITFHTVGGRTSAVVEALQVLPDAVREVVEGKLRVALEKKAAKVAANGAIARQGKRLYSSDEEDPSAAAEKEEVDAEVATAALQGWLDHEGLAGTVRLHLASMMLMSSRHRPISRRSQRQRAQAQRSNSRNRSSHQQSQIGRPSCRRPISQGQ